MMVMFYPEVLARRVLSRESTYVEHGELTDIQRAQLDALGGGAVAGEAADEAVALASGGIGAYVPKTVDDAR